MKIGNIEVWRNKTKKRKCLGIFFNNLVPQGPDFRRVEWEMFIGFWHTFIVLSYVKKKNERSISISSR